jgi:branched-chain amino acid transport system substrate-binding protein
MDQKEPKKFNWWLPLGIVILLVVLVGGLSWWNQRAWKAQGPIKVGFVGPLTGSSSLWGTGAKNMTDLAAEEINQNGGIKGRDLKITYEDGKCTAADAVTASQKLINDGVKFILGGQCSPETVAMAPTSKNNSFFMLAGVTSSDDAVASSTSAFRTSPPTIDFAKQLAPLAIAKYKNVATLTEQAAFSTSYTKDFIDQFKSAGGTITDSENYTTDQTDFRTNLLKIKATNPDAIFISPQNPATAVNVLKQMQELGIKTPVFGNSVLVTKTVYEQSGKPQSFVGAFSIVPYTDTKSAKATELASKYKAKFGTDVPYNFFYVGAAYDATYMLAEGLKNCGNNDVKCVSDYMKKINYPGVTADYTFKSNGDSNFNSWATITIGDDGEGIVKPL